MGTNENREPTQGQSNPGQGGQRQNDPNAPGQGGQPQPGQQPGQGGDRQPGQNPDRNDPQKQDQQR